MKSNTRKQTGFSLIELMVALVISLLLLAGILQIFSGTKKTYTMEEELSRLQEKELIQSQFAVKNVSLGQANHLLHVPRQEYLPVQDQLFDIGRKFG